LNTAKTEILWSTTGRRLHQLPQLPFRVGTDEVVPVSVVLSVDHEVTDSVLRNLSTLVDKFAMQKNHRLNLVL